MLARCDDGRSNDVVVSVRLVDKVMEAVGRRRSKPERNLAVDDCSEVVGARAPRLKPGPHHGRTSPSFACPTCLPTSILVL